MLGGDFNGSSTKVEGLLQSSDGMIKVIICDDQEVVCLGLDAILKPPIT